MEMKPNQSFQVLRGSDTSCLRHVSPVSPSQLHFLRRRISSHLRTSNLPAGRQQVSSESPVRQSRRSIIMSDGQVSPNHSNRDHLREMVRTRQKRKTTSCWPCRDRKVKCDKSQPCEICVKRGYPDLCWHERPNSQNPSVNPRPATQTRGSSTRTQTSSGVESRPGTEDFTGINGHF
jgi:hypothetical protein